MSIRLAIGFLLSVGAGTALGGLLYGVTLEADL